MRSRSAGNRLPPDRREAGECSAQFVRGRAIEGRALGADLVEAFHARAQSDPPAALPVAFETASFPFAARRRTGPAAAPRGARRHPPSAPVVPRRCRWRGSARRRTPRTCRPARAVGGRCSRPRCGASGRRSSGGCSVGAFWHIADGSEGSTIDVVQTSSVRAWGWYLRITGVDTVAPINAASADLSSGSSAPSRTLLRRRPPPSRTAGSYV